MREVRKVRLRMRCSHAEPDGSCSLGSKSDWKTQEPPRLSPPLASLTRWEFLEGGGGTLGISDCHAAMAVAFDRRRLSRCCTTSSAESRSCRDSAQCGVSSERLLRKYPEMFLIRIPSSSSQVFSCATGFEDQNLNLSKLALPLCKVRDAFW